MRRWIGRWIVGVAVVHLGVGILLYGGFLGDALADGWIGAFDADVRRALAFWFMATGMASLIMGIGMDALEAAGLRFPAPLTWALLLLTIAAITAMPRSGGWLFLPAAMGALVRSRKSRLEDS